MELDLSDRRILYALDHNSRQSYSSIAKKLRQGRDLIAYRIERLVARGILKHATVTINPYKLGLTLYKTYLKIEKGTQSYQELLAFLERHPRVYWIADCDGRWDLIFSTFARSAFEFHQIQNRIIAQFSDLILAFNVYSLVNVWMYRKNYLLGEGSNYFFLGGAPSEYQLERLEWQILRLLARDARMPISEIAQKLKSTEMMVRYRIEKMEQAGLIAGYRIELDLAKLEMTFFKAQLYLRDYTEEAHKALREFCAAHPHITYYIEQLGECEVELELEVKSYLQYSEIINEMRLKFPKLIRNVETVLIRRAWFKWVPYDVAAN